MKVGPRKRWLLEVAFGEASQPNERRRRGILLHDSSAATLGMMEQLVDCLREEQNFERALPLQERAYGGTCRRYGETAERTLHSAERLALVYVGLGRYEEAIALESRVLSGRVAIRGDRHPYTLLSTVSLADMLSRNGDHEGAAEKYRQAAEITEATAGASSTAFVEALARIAAQLVVAGQVDEGCQIAERAIRIGQELGPSAASVTNAAMDALSSGLMRLGRLTESEELKRQVLIYFMQSLGPNSRDSIRTMRQLSNVLYLQGNLDEARLLARQGRDLALEQFGPADREVAYTNELLIAITEQGNSSNP